MQTVCKYKDARGELMQEWSDNDYDGPITRSMAKARAKQINSVTARVMALTGRKMPS